VKIEVGGRIGSYIVKFREELIFQVLSLTMKFIPPFCLVFLLAVCGSKPGVESNADTLKMEPVAEAVIQAKDSAEEQPVAPLPTTQETVKEKSTPGVKTVKCKYQKFEQGDCMHYLFDCGDFGPAVTSGLPKDQADLWNNLMAFGENHGDYPITNPQYEGKTFEIVYNMIETDVCAGDGVSVKQSAPNLISFKLVQ
jgi:hypothetical protein